MEKNFNSIYCRHYISYISKAKVDLKVGISKYFNTIINNKVDICYYITFLQSYRNYSTCMLIN